MKILGIFLTLLDRIGGGESNEYNYYTWEIKICRECGRLVKESYSAIVVSENEVSNLRKQS